MLSGGSVSELGYTGHYQHESELVLAPFRALDPQCGRWLSEDPIAEEGGVNLYSYVSSDVIGTIDRLGLANLNLFSKRDPLHSYGNSPTTNGIGAYTVAGHASFTSPTVIGDDRLSDPFRGPDIDAAELLKTMYDKGYKRGTPIILLACESTGVAQELAMIAGVPVAGNSACMWSGDSRIYESQKIGGEWRPMRHKPGHQSWYAPDGNEILPPGYRSSRKDPEGNYPDNIARISVPSWVTNRR